MKEKHQIIMLLLWKKNIETDRRKNWWNKWKEHQKKKNNPIWTGICISDDNFCSYWQNIMNLCQSTWRLITPHAFSSHFLPSTKQDTFITFSLLPFPSKILKLLNIYNDDIKAFSFLKLIVRNNSTKLIIHIYL